MKKFKLILLLLLFYRLPVYSQNTNIRHIDTAKIKYDFIVGLTKDSLWVSLYSKPVLIYTYNQLDDYIRKNLKKITKGYMLYAEDSGTPPSALADSITYLLVGKYKIKKLVATCTCF